MERLSDKILVYLQSAMGRDVNLRDIRTFLKIEPGSKDDQNLRTQMSTNLVTKKIVKPSGKNDGIYKVLFPVEPVNWWDSPIKEEPLDFKFPRCYEDGTEFGFEDLVEVFAGDMILIAGASNYGKTTMALSIMGENLGLMPVVLMGSEYTASDGKISPKFRRRMKRMSWVKWITDDNKPRFELLPVGSDYEDYIKPDALNAIDWISLPGEYYLIDRVMKSIKDRIGTGVGVAVLQKNRTMEFAEGGERAERYADVCMYIDPYGNESMVRMGKVKAPKDKATGRMWAFSIVDYGANFHNIREIVKCNKCWGKGYTGSANYYKKCEVCNGLKFIDL